MQKLPRKGKVLFHVFLLIVSGRTYFHSENMYFFNVVGFQISGFPDYCTCTSRISRYLHLEITGFSDSWIARFSYFQTGSQAGGGEAEGGRTDGRGRRHGRAGGWPLKGHDGKTNHQCRSHDRSLAHVQQKHGI